MLVRVRVTNNADRTLPPFGDAGSGLGILLIDSSGQRYEATSASYGLPHGAALANVPSGATFSGPLVFQLPATAHVNGVVFWDIFEDGDGNGSTYVYFRAGPTRAVRELGPAAQGAAFDH